MGRRRDRAAIIASLVRSVIRNPNFQWGQVGHYLFDHRIIHGVVVTPS